MDFTPAPLNLEWPSLIRLITYVDLFSTEKIKDPETNTWGTCLASAQLIAASGPLQSKFTL